jgi:hypothetical protein
MMNAKLTVHCPASGGIQYMWLQWKLHGVPHSGLYPWKAATGLGLKVAHAGEADALDYLPPHSTTSPSLDYLLFRSVTAGAGPGR